jgi:hypothetical protein
VFLALPHGTLPLWPSNSTPTPGHRLCRLPPKPAAGRSSTARRTPEAGPTDCPNCPARATGCAVPSGSPFPAAIRPRRCWRCGPRSPRTSSSRRSRSSPSAAPPEPAGPPRPTCSARRSSGRPAPTTSAGNTATPRRSHRASRP